MTTITKKVRMMFKKIAYSVVLGGMLAGFAACSADPDYKDGVYLMGEKFSFYQNSLSSTTLPGDAEYTVDIIRTTTQGAVTLPLTLESVDGRVLDGVTVSDAVFADGSNKATVTISIANAMPPNVYGGKLSMAADKVSVTGNSSLNFSIGVEYEWEDMEGTGWFKLPNFIWFDTWVEIEHWQKAKGFDRWRALNPMEAVYKVNDPNSPVTGTWGDPAWSGWDYDLSTASTAFEFFDAGNGHLSYEPFCIGMKFGGTKPGYYVSDTWVGTLFDKKIGPCGSNLDGYDWVEPLHGVCYGYAINSDGNPFPAITRSMGALIEFTMPGYGE